MNKAIKRILKILKRVFVTLFLTVYILIAVLNFNFVQTTLGHLASSFFSKAWNAEVKIGGISLSVFDHLTIYNILLKDPSGKLVLQADKVKCSFSGFPLGNGLNVRKVYLKNATFNLIKDENGLNLSFMLDYFKSNKPKEDKESNPFPIRVKRLEMDNVNFSLFMPKSDTVVVKKTPKGGVDVSNMAFNNTHADIRDIQVINDSIHAYFKNFSTVEQSGFKVEQIAMDATVSKKGIKVSEAHIKTPHSELFFDASLAYHDWATMKYFIDSVQMKAKIKEGSYANMSDGGVWAATSPIFGMHAKVNVELDFEGTVANMRSKFFKVSFGKESLIIGKGSLKGLPNIDETIIDVEITDLKTTVNDVNNFKYPNIKLPKMLEKMGYMDMKAHFLGKIKNFDASVLLLSEIGNVEAKAKVFFDEKLKDYAYSGDVMLENFFPSSLINNDMLKKANLDINFTGQSFSLEKLNAQVKGACYDFIFQNQVYDSLVFNVTASDQIFNGNLHLVDEDTGLDFDGIVNLQNLKMPKCDFVADIRNANLTKLNLFKTRDSNTIISAKIDADFKGKTLDNLLGRISIQNLKYIEGSKSIKVKELLVSVTDSNSEKEIDLHSDLLNFNMNGRFRFNDFEVLASRIMSNYIPQYFNRSSAFKPEGIMENPYCKFSLTLFDTKDLLSVFIPSLNIATNTQLLGNYTLNDGLVLGLNCDSVKINTLKLSDIKLNAKPTDNDFYNINITLENMIAGNLTYFENTNCNINSRSDLLELHLSWNDKKDTVLNSGQINLYAHTEPFIINLQFRDSKLLVNGEEWEIEQQNIILYSETDLNINELVLKTEDQSIEINSEISDDGADEMVVNFHQFKIEQFNAILNDFELHSSGTIDGKFEINGIKKTPYFKSDLTIKNLNINYEKLGDATIKASWDSQLERVAMDLKIIYTGNKATTTPIFLSGYFYPLREKDNYDISLAFQNFKLKTIAGYLRSFSSRLEGNLTGNLKVKGDLKTPSLQGDLAIDYGKIKIDFLNTTYDFAEKIEITENAISLKNFTLTDSLANQATISGKLTHDGFKDFAFDLDLKSKSFMLMNVPRKAKSIYYGSVVADLDAEVHGDMNKLVVNASAKTGRGTSITIPITGKASVSKQQFINFVAEDTTITEALKAVSKQSQMEIDVNVHLEVTPDAKVNIPLDYNEIKGTLISTGKGNLVVTANTKKSDFNIFGTYTVDKGSFAMSFLDIIWEKTFELEKGGTLIWAGDPTGAIMNISAMHQTRASLKSLFANTDNANSSMYNQKINVQNIIQLKGQLTAPNITFDIRLPYSDPTTEDLVFSVIDRNDQNQMLAQTAKLLLFNSFYSEQGGLSMNMSGYDVLGNIVSSFIPYVNVGFSYDNETSTTDVTLAKDIGKFHVDVTGSSASNNPQGSTDPSFSTNISYKWNDRVSVYTFNRPNSDDITKDNVGYTQGVGITYQRAFDRIMEIFKRKTTEEKAMEKELKLRAKAEKKRERQAKKEAEEKEKAARKERERLRKAKKKQ